jgi:folate-binding Fe-S cluster repair protein YgfZ
LLFCLKVQIENVDNYYKLFSLIKISQIEQPEIKLEASNKAFITKDPRWEQLGYRCIIKIDSGEDKKDIDCIKLFFKFNQKILCFKYSNIKVTNLANVKVEKNLNDYKKFLFRNGIAENNENFKQGSSIPNEYNIVFLNGGSLRKTIYKTIDLKR